MPRSEASRFASLTVRTSRGARRVEGVILGRVVGEGAPGTSEALRGERAGREDFRECLGGKGGADARWKGCQN